MKRGPKPEGHYHVTGRTKWPREIDDLAGRRTCPFLDHIGLDGRSISFLLKEAYLQGIKDAVQATEQPVE